MKSFSLEIWLIGIWPALNNDFVKLTEYSESALKLYRMKGFPYYNEIFF